MNVISWDTVFYLDGVLAGEFERIIDDIGDNSAAWFNWTQAEDPQVALLPESGNRNYPESTN